MRLKPEANPNSLESERLCITMRKESTDLTEWLGQMSLNKTLKKWLGALSYCSVLSASLSSEPPVSSFLISFHHEEV
jgi:hypothetical protein